MKLPIYQVDAFAGKLFQGNPAAVVPCTHWLKDELLQDIAAENNLSETAFFVREDQGYRLRWFTPTREVSLCGHATLAAATVLWEKMGYVANEITFQSHSGALTVRRQAGFYYLDFPQDPVSPVEAPQALIDAMGQAPKEIFQSERENWVLLYSAQDEIQQLSPDFEVVKAQLGHGVVVTAPGEECDFVSRYFVPAYGINEDPVTGSTHAALFPFWANRLSIEKLTAQQLSSRGGALTGSVLPGDRVEIGGKAVCYLEGHIFVSSGEDSSGV